MFIEKLKVFASSASAHDSVWNLSQNFLSLSHELYLNHIHGWSEMNKNSWQVIIVNWCFRYRLPCMTKRFQIFMQSNMYF